jgi:hypothetical protein
MHVALYKAEGKLFNKITRWGEHSPYSHVEIVHEDKGATFGLSSSFRDKGVRIKPIVFKRENWDFVDISALVPDHEVVLQYFRDKEGSPYDIKNIIRFGFAPTKENVNKYVCSEICAGALGWSEPWRYGPGLFAARIVDEVNRAHGSTIYTISEKGKVANIKYSDLALPSWVV